MADKNTPAMIAAKALVNSPEVQRAAKKEAKLRLSVMINDWKFWFFMAVTFTVGYVIFIEMRPLIYVAVAVSLVFAGLLYAIEWCRDRRAAARAEEGEKQSLVA
eukprot:c12543_g1_i4.p2 GENE.c12543_g1_i4~~c12543_g1_i4.p2  ORF type:complete len:104 (-),score=30.41 c12543_g1_i4:17-328(-)